MAESKVDQAKLRNSMKRYTDCKTWLDIQPPLSSNV